MASEWSTFNGVRLECFGWHRKAPFHDIFLVEKNHV